MGDERPTLEYGARNGWRVPRWAVRLTVVFAVTWLVWVGGEFVPVDRAESSVACSVCGVERRTVTTRFAGWRRSATTDVDLEKGLEYEVLVGAPHAHDWRRRGATSVHGSPWGWRSIGCGGPEWKGIVAGRALEFVRDVCGAWGRDERRAVYDRLIGTKDEDEFGAVVAEVGADAQRRRGRQ